MLNGLVIDINRFKKWYKEDELHRDDGPAIENANGVKEWYQEGKLHRGDGPAIEYINDDKEWYKEGKLHREDGPAIDYNNGVNYYYYNGKYINCNSIEEFTIIITNKSKLSIFQNELNDAIKQAQMIASKNDNQYGYEQARLALWLDELFLARYGFQSPGYTSHSDIE